VDRTIRLPLFPTPEQAAALAETTRQFTAVFNAACICGWENRVHNAIRLHYLVYHPLRAQYPALASDLHIQARARAAQTVRSAFALAKKGRKVSAPRSRSCPPRYNLHTFKLDWAAGLVRLSSVSGRMTVPFRVPEYAGRYVGCKTRTADLVERDGRFWLHVSLDVPAPQTTLVNAVVGVDLGIAQSAVTSDARFLGEGSWRNTEDRYFRVRRALQKRGTKSAKRHLGRLRGKQSRFRQDCDHVLSKAIVQTAPPGATIVLEDLTNIRSRVRVQRGQQARRLHSWSFNQLRQFVEYKAEERGCTVALVDPRHTSQRCSRCGHTARDNRRSRALFVCRQCGFSLHADLNGARNIAAKYRAGLGMSEPGGPPVNRPIVAHGDISLQPQAVAP